VFKSIAVIGPGLLGGSILKAVRKCQPKCELRVWARRVQSLEYIREHQLADWADTDLKQVVTGAELIILAMPIQFMAQVVADFPKLTNDVIVTDVGSTKVTVVSSLNDVVRDLGGTFIGSHPMAGSEKTGIEHSREDLFQGAAVIMTPLNRVQSTTQQGTINLLTDGCEIERVKQFWELIGGEVTLMTPGEHDVVVAAVSHLPHLLAAALVRSVLGKNTGRALFSGNGFRDTTRIAGGDPDMWTDIMLANREAILKELEILQDELGKWREILGSLDKDQLRRFLSEAKEIRDQI
jgi:prephenate dehydrogenase